MINMCVLNFFVSVCLLGFCFLKETDSMPYYSRSDQLCNPPKGDVCIEIRKCPFFSELLDRSPIPRPRGVIRIIRDHQCGFENNIPKVCCFLPTPPPTTSTSTTPAPQEFQILDKLNNPTAKRHPNYHLLPVDKCGLISPKSRITGGTKVNLDEFPWMALIAYFTKDGLDFRCGGTIINDRYVLTAAHCIVNSTIVGVRLGEFNVTSTDDCDGDYCASPVQDFYIENFLIHPEYDPKTFQNDIALIRLATPANFSNANVQPICLPLDDNDDITGKFAIVSGWGVTEDGYKSSILLKASVPVLPTQNCQKLYKTFAPVTEKQLCAGGYDGKDSCAGDSGGPMKYVGLINGSPRFIQYGIVSYGPRHCGVKNRPGVYTRVASYIIWILDNIKPSEEN